MVGGRSIRTRREKETYHNTVLCVCVCVYVCVRTSVVEAVVASSSAVADETGTVE